MLLLRLSWFAPDIPPLLSSQVSWSFWNPALKYKLLQWTVARCLIIFYNIVSLNHKQTEMNIYVCWSWPLMHGQVTVPIPAFLPRSGIQPFSECPTLAGALALSVISLPLLSKPSFLIDFTPGLLFSLGLVLAYYERRASRNPFNVSQDKQDRELGRTILRRSGTNE